MVVVGEPALDSAPKEGRRLPGPGRKGCDRKVQSAMGMRRPAQGGGQGRLRIGVALELNPESRGEGACEGLEGRVWAAPEAGLLKKPQRPG